MRFLRRRGVPKELDRRRPENADLRLQFEAQEKQRTKIRAQFAEQLTEENGERIAQVDAAVRALGSRLGGSA